MLHNFLLAERDRILALCAQKLLRVSDARNSSEEMERGLPVFYDELYEVLRADEQESSQAVDHFSNSVHRDEAIRRGKESLRLGYTISQVVHGYGTLCQAITEYVTEQGGEPIHAREFNRLNFCLDVAIAEAVTEFSQGQRDATAREEVQRLGFLAHEMRNALSNAVAAHHLIKKGVVGFCGSTSRVLEDALSRMKDIIDQSLSEVRLRGDQTVERLRWRVIDLVGEVEATATFEASARAVQLNMEVAPELEIDADRHLVVSAISNLVQNAVKFTRLNGNVWIRGTCVEGRVLLEIEDECGGFPPGSIEELFRPFSQTGTDRTGVGLGLLITRRALSLNDGQVSARDIPGKGCVFTIDLPRAPALPREREDVSIITSCTSTNDRLVVDTN